jgi:hypothetical protein
MMRKAPGKKAFILESYDYKQIVAIKFIRSENVNSSLNKIRELEKEIEDVKKFIEDHKKDNKRKQKTSFAKELDDVQRKLRCVIGESVMAMCQTCKAVDYYEGEGFYLQWRCMCQTFELVNLLDNRKNGDYTVIKLVLFQYNENPDLDNRYDFARSYHTLTYRIIRDKYSRELEAIRVKEENEKITQDNVDFIDDEILFDVGDEILFDNDQNKNCSDYGNTNGDRKLIKLYALIDAFENCNVAPQFFLATMKKNGITKKILSKIITEQPLSNLITHNLNPDINLWLSKSWVDFEGKVSF